MALRWDFKKDLIGWYEDSQTKESKSVVRLYDGNALMIAVWENDESDNYWLHSFFFDEEHAKNCLDGDCIYPKEAVFHLFRGKKSCKILARLFARFEVSVIWEDEK